jgi:hypothetical protein
MKTLKDLFVPYDLAVMAKEKGFDLPCFACFGIHSQAFFEPDGKLHRNGAMDGFDGYSVRAAAPTHQQLTDWLREEHKIHLTNIESRELYSFTVKWHNGICFNEMPCKGGEYYEAYNAALEVAMKLI